MARKKVSSQVNQRTLLTYREQQGDPKEKAVQRTPTKKRTVGKNGEEDEEIETFDVDEVDDEEDRPTREAKADERKKIDKKISEALLGYARVDMADPELRMAFGKFNPRPYDPKEVTKLVGSFKAEGVKRWELAHAIPIGLPSSILRTSQLRAQIPSDSKNLPELKNVLQHDLYQLEPYGGQHRYYAIRRLVQEAERWVKGGGRNAIARKEKQLQEAQASARDSKDAAEAPGKDKIVRVLKQELALLRIETEEQEDILRIRGQWLVAVYDAGMYYVLRTGGLAYPAEYREDDTWRGNRAITKCIFASVRGDSGRVDYELYAGPRHVPGGGATR